MIEKYLDRIALVVLGFVVVLGVLFASGLTVRSGHVQQEVNAKVKVAPSVLSAQTPVPSDSRVYQVRMETVVLNPPAEANVWLALWRAPIVIVSIAIAAIVWTLGKSVAVASVFTKQNVIKLRLLSALLITMPFLKYFTDWAREHFLEFSSIADVPLAPLVFSWSPALVGIAVLFMAEAFAAGRRAEQDVQGLI